MYGTVNMDVIEISEMGPANYQEEIDTLSLSVDPLKDKSQIENPKVYRSYKDRLIISSENKIKSFFDVWVLLLVGYSCFTSMYYVAF